jgi:hypothetical protein
MHRASASHGRFFTRRARVSPSGSLKLDARDLQEAKALLAELTEEPE